MLYLAFEVLWRGLLYGLADGLLLTVFPSLAVLNLLHGDLSGVVRKVTYVVGAYALVFLVTLVYHAGYGTYRSNGFGEDGLGGPLTGSPIWSAPALLTANPLGALVTHSTLHVSAVVHEYETELFLPPHTTAH